MNELAQGEPIPRVAITTTTRGKAHETTTQLPHKSHANPKNTGKRLEGPGSGFIRGVTTV